MINLRRCQPAVRISSLRFRDQSHRQAQAATAQPLLQDRRQRIEQARIGLVEAELGDHWRQHGAHPGIRIDPPAGIEILDARQREFDGEGESNTSAGDADKSAPFSVVTVSSLATKLAPVAFSSASGNCKLEL